MQNLILLALCVLTTGFIGWNILCLLSGRKGLESLFVAEKIGLSYLLGFGVITIQMFVMGLLGMRFTRLTILLPWVFVAVVNLAWGLRGMRSAGGGPFRFHVTDITLVALIALETCYNFFRALIKPIEAYDSVAIYGLKAKIMYLAGGIPSDFFRSLAVNFNGAHADYPLLIPLSETWVYTFLGSFNDILVKAIFPSLYASFLLIFYAVLKRITENRTLALLCTFALGSIKQFSDYATIGIADLALGVYFSVCIFYLYLWFKSRNGSFLNISLLGAILSLWTKNEGMLLALIAVFIFLSYVIANIKKIGKNEILHFFAYALVIFIATLSFSMFKSHNNLVNENFNFSMVTIRNLTANLNRLPMIFYEYQKQIFGFKKWNIIWIMSILILFKYFKSAFRGNLKYVTAAIFLFLLGYTSVYIFSAVELDFFLRKSFSRFLLHILPITVFWTVLLAKKGHTPYGF